MPDINAKIKQIIKEKDAGIKSANKAILELLKELQKQTIESIKEAAVGTWDAYHLNQTLSSIEHQISVFTPRVKAEMSEALTESWRKGQEMVDKPLAMMDIHTGWYLSTDTLDTLKEFAFHRLDKLSDDAWLNIKSELHLGILGGKSPTEIVKAIGRNLTSPSIFGSLARRAEVIMHTEMGRVFSQATQLRMEQTASKVPGMKKEWWHAGHPKIPRPSHVLADGQRVDVDKPFIVGGTKIMFPRAPGTPLEHVINCYDSETEILTDCGYKFFYELTHEDKIAVMNPETREFIYMIPEAIIKQSYKGKMVHIKNRTADLMITPDHDMPVINQWKNKIEFRKAANLRVNEVLPKRASWNGEDKSIIIKEKQYDAKDFMCFMGWYLSEGNLVKSSRWSRDRKKKYQCRVQICIRQSQTANPEKYKEIFNLCKRLFKQVWAGKDRIYIAEDSIVDYLMPLGKSWEKFIPFELKKLKSELLKILLNSFCSGDGYIIKRKIQRQKDRRIFFTSSLQLADDLAELIIKCGKNPSFNFPKEKDYKEVTFKNGTYFIYHPCVSIFENNSEKLHIRKKYRNLIDYDGQTFCVRMPKWHIINTRRNGKTVWCGNCGCDHVPWHENWGKKGSEKQ